MSITDALLALLVLLFTAACGTALAATAAYALLAWTPLLRWLAP